MTSSYGPSFNFAQFPVAVNDNEQDASGGNGGNGGSSGAATSNPFVAAIGNGGAGGPALANGGSNQAGDGVGAAQGGDGLGAGGDANSVLSLFGIGGDGNGTGGSAAGLGAGGDATGANGGNAAGGNGGSGPAAAVNSAANSGAGGNGGNGGSGGINSADQNVNTSANLGFNESFTDDDGFDLKGADVKGSFNSDDDGVDNSGGTISGSNVANGNQTGVGNSQETTTITDSFNTDESVTAILQDVGNETTTTTNTFTNSGNTTTTTTSTTLDNVGNVDDSFSVGGDFDPDLLDVDVQNVLNNLDI